MISNNSSLQKYWKGLLSELEALGFDTLKNKHSLDKKNKDVRKATHTWQLAQTDQNWVNKNNATIVYTDASAGEVSSWSWWVSDEKQQSGIIIHNDNNIAELMAITKAITTLPGSLLIVSDMAISTIKMGTLRKESFTQNGEWAKTLSRIICNWYSLVRSNKIRYVHTKGHMSCEGNKKADFLAYYTKHKALLTNPNGLKQQSDVFLQQETNRKTQEELKEALKTYKKIVKKIEKKQQEDDLFILEDYLKTYRIKDQRQYALIKSQLEKI